MTLLTEAKKKMDVGKGYYIVADDALGELCRLTI
jgi:hypothetical protein